MAYAVYANKSSHCNPEEQAVGKMETSIRHDSMHTSTHDHVSDRDENAQAVTGESTMTTEQQHTARDDGPALTPLHLPPPDQSGSNTAGGSSGGAAVGTPSTVSTAPSTEDDASLEALGKVGLEKLHHLWEDDAADPVQQPVIPREQGIPPVIPNIPNQPPVRANARSGAATARLTPVQSNPRTEQQQNNHRRAKSWEAGTSQNVFGATPRTGATGSDGRPTSLDTSVIGMPNFSLPGAHPAFSTNYYQGSPTGSPPYSLPATPPRAQGEHPWAAPVTQPPPPQPRVASFRTDPSILEANAGRKQPHYAYPPAGPGPDQWAPPRGEGQQQPRPKFVGQPPPAAASGYHTPPYPPYKMSGQAAAGYQHSPPLVSTPPRPRNPRQPGGPNPHRQIPPAVGGPPAVATPPRSSSEILKTLLRKKACLYEPETSRAVALVTWMVGRELAMEFGYFSRQQLQSGVHACVAKKIESGAITRTKVNRCMQIILNSCFHYIIPRPDGTEESGDAFREAFAQQAKDDSYLVRTLGPPWDDLLADREEILKAAIGQGESTPSPDDSPRLESVRRGPRGGESQPGGEGAPKRTVLLCFNENVRSVEDVFRCHTEFIRDTANSSKLQLSAQEWRSFFGKQHAVPSLQPDGTSSNIGASSSLLGVPNSLTQPFDLLGQMNPTEVAQFRTTWCAKRYDHDHDLCGFAHVGVSGGWLRRNPSLHSYNDEMCSSVARVLDDRWGPRCFVINSCPKGEECPYAHSKEEIDYHPNRYKSHTCSTLYSRAGTPVMGRCSLGDLCPHLHPTEASSSSPPASGAPSPPRMPDARSKQPPSPTQPPQQQQHRRSGREYPRSGGAGGAASSALPDGAPMLYVDPAPVSRFERRLGMPGLQSLFRRHCYVIHEHLRDGSDKCKCYYSNFGDDWGMSFKAL